MDIGMKEEPRSEISGLLAKVLADTYLLLVKTQNFHWNVAGPQFFSLHLLFEKQYGELFSATDEIAERIRALGFFVEASAEGFKKISSIREDSRVLTAHEMLDQLLKGHEQVIRELRRLLELAEKEGDGATVDLIGRRMGAHEKAAWMLRSQV